jgi:hypothetical protein
MIDLGGFDARATVISGAAEQARVFAEHRARVEALANEPLMQDGDRKLFQWFATRVDARYAFRRAWGLTKDLNGHTIET